jgi:integrase/recombinase XerD
MASFSQLFPAAGAARCDPLRLAAAAYLARFAGLSRTHTESDLRAYPCWCADRGLDPLAAGRPQVELYVRWMQEVRRLKPSTVGRRMSVVAGFYRTAVIDGYWPTRRPTTSAGHRSPRSHPRSG